MKKKLLFLGNDGNLINEIRKLRHIELIGASADETSDAERKYFGSAFSVAKKSGVPVVSQKYFNMNYKRCLRTLFKGAEIIFSQGYRYKIKNDLLQDKRIKFINFHQSLLPHYAGRHPLNWAIIRGEKETGITFHYINGNFDEGDILLQRKLRISEKDDIISLYIKTIRAAAGLIPAVFERVYDRAFRPVKQALDEKMYFRPRMPADGEILDNDTVRQVKDKIRALLFPYPGAFIYLDGERVVIEGVSRLKSCARYSKIEFAGRQGSGIVLRAADGLLKARERKL